MEKVNSEIFGESTLLSPTDEEYRTLKKLILKYPINAFGIINNKLNKQGYITKLTKMENL